jgi:hypothetical protein
MLALALTADLEGYMSTIARQEKWCAETAQRDRSTAS